MKMIDTVRKINQLEDHYCHQCLIKKTLRQDSKTKAHHYCISKCSVGLQIKQWGNNLQ
ncbi:zinc-finger domain-containing protein [Macrococcus carouselicus]|uniref:Zinc-finger domain-containing protein n=1 Tax=Macrococcus carouselicus TaxID=69969 RepID=A0A9Q8FQZ3_9STAP|nr:zinc-finger domain-containing protein [Macrococcus carouselicus]TDM04238.1 zinc-finger domain-containing protein [Macrococcus carouselicus]